MNKLYYFDFRFRIRFHILKLYHRQIMNWNIKLINILHFFINISTKGYLSWIHYLKIPVRYQVPNTNAVRITGKYTKKIYSEAPS